MDITLIDRASGTKTRVDYRSFVSRNQFTHLIEDPFAIVHLAKYLNRKSRKKGIVDPIVRARIVVSFNARPPQLMINPTVDLSRVDISAASQNWIMPLIEHENAEHQPAASEL
eukprot:CAMPEP_0168579596 /NCGR_PEP_ID=MMETSP0420-20121227/313_1 /TAXON_ID=498008 /ORGANISM="Pessonella sp." /LENGTH=112 /DNA_ID=CAMNT_0008613587 /DNA_START=1035 /DNA_END=1373 /DNA_ORIENTATION=+